MRAPARHACLASGVCGDPLEEIVAERIARAADMCRLVRELVFRVHRMHDHGVVDLEHQQTSIAGLGTVDADVVEPGACMDRRQCIAMLQRELQQLTRPADVYITHIKPGEVETVMAEIGAQHNPHRIRALQTGQLMAWPDTSGNV